MTKKASAFPLDIDGRTVQDAGGLRALLVEDAHGGTRRMHHVHPADAWLEAMEAAPEITAAVESLVVEMVAEEHDPAVLTMVVVLGRRVGGKFADAAARRVVDGPPIPEVPGIGFPTLEETLRQLGRSAGVRLRKKLDKTGDAMDVLRAKVGDADVGMVDALQAAADEAPDDVPVPIVGTVAMLVGAMFPEEILRAAKAVKGLSDEHKKAFLDDASGVLPDQRAAIEAALR